MRRTPTIAFHRNVTTIVLGLVLALAAAACGTAGDGGTPTTASSTSMPATTAGPTTPPPTSAPDTTAAPTTTPPPSTPPPTAPADTCTAEASGSIEEHTAFFAWCGPQGDRPPFPVIRTMEDPPDLRTKLELLVRGTKGYEQDRGLHTGFDWVDERDQIEVSVAIDAAGVATVDFLVDGERWTPGSRAATSHQLIEFLDPFEATVFSDPAVTAIDRSTLCWGELGCAGITTREEWEGALFVNHGLICDLEHVAHQHWGCVPLEDPLYRATVVGVAVDDVLNLRAGPGVGYFVVGAIPPGSEVDVVDRGRFADDGGFWQVVRRPDGDAGWVNAAFLADTATLGARTPEEQLVDAFVRFAAEQSAATFDALPLATTVALGLADAIATEVPAGDLQRPSTWVLDVEDFRASVGPFSALDLLVHADPSHVTVGEHDHCAAPPVPLPAGYEDHTQISMQPRDGSYDSCLMWGTVDFFLNDDGDVEAITMDLWEP